VKLGRDREDIRRNRPITVVLLLQTPGSKLEGCLQQTIREKLSMCFHIGPEFVEALTSRAADKSAVDASPKVSGGTHQSEEHESQTTFEHLASRLRAFILAGATIKWLLFILWVCL
jgi:hypothetical protein